MLKKISKKSFLFMFIFLMLLGILIGCNKRDNIKKSKENKQVTELKGQTQYPLTIKDSYKRNITIDKEPEKIISLAPNITETIFALRKGEKLIGRTEFCDYPSEVKKITSIGELSSPNIEKITELKPDIVIASTHFKKETLKKLESLGIKVIVFYGTQDFAGTYEYIKKMGIVLNSKDEANKIINNMKNQVEEVKNQVEDKNKPKVYYVVSYGKGGDYTAGKDTFIGEMLEIAGGKNVANDVKGWKYSIEKLLEKNPDIIICSKNFNTKEGIKNTNGYKELEAVKKDRLYEIDENLITRQGPRLSEGLYQLAKIIHPEIFK